MTSIDPGKIRNAFGREIYYHTTCALHAWEQMSRLGDPDVKEAWKQDFANLDLGDACRYYAELFVNHTAMLSKYFFSRKNPSRSQILRNEFPISEASMLNNSAVRNTFQHRDERIDDALSGKPSGAGFQFGGDSGSGFFIKIHDSNLSVHETGLMIQEMIALKAFIEERYKSMSRQYRKINIDETGLEVSAEDSSFSQQN